MRKLLLTSALGSAVLLLSACNNADTVDEDAADTTVVETEDTGTATTASTDWPAGTRIVEEGDTFVRINPDNTRVVLDDGWRIVTEDGVRYRVDPAGTRVRIDERGLDVDGVLSGPDVEGVDVDVGTNDDGNLDVDVSTDGDATPGR